MQGMQERLPAETELNVLGLCYFTCALMSPKAFDGTYVGTTPNCSSITKVGHSEVSNIP